MELCLEAIEQILNRNRERTNEQTKIQITVSNNEIDNLWANKCLSKKKFTETKSQCFKQFCYKLLTNLSKIGIPRINIELDEREKRATTIKWEWIYKYRSTSWPAYLGLLPSSSSSSWLAFAASCQKSNGSSVIKLAIICKWNGFYFSLNFVLLWT